MSRARWVILELRRLPLEPLQFQARRLMVPVVPCRLALEPEYEPTGESAL